jgi:hypothetical protein
MNHGYSNMNMHKLLGIPSMSTWIRATLRLPRRHIKITNVNLKKSTQNFNNALAQGQNQLPLQIML